MWLPHSFLGPQSLVKLLLFFLLLSPYANGAITSTKIDDTDASFSFPPDWNAITPSSPCGGCSTQPDNISQIFEQTWHDGNYMAGDDQTTTGSFTFTGQCL